MTTNVQNVSGWETTTLYSIDEVLKTLDWLMRNEWITRGQSKCWGKLYPKIDRKPLNILKNREKRIQVELRSIRLFQEIAMSLASEAERKELKHDMNTLMVLQHYGVPTRLLDWSLLPYVATFFSIYTDPNIDGELWGFSCDGYEKRGAEHWKKYTRIPLDSPIGVRYAMAFDKEEPKPDFFICVVDYLTHHRIDAQKGVFSMTASLGKDHSKSISKLFGQDGNWYHRYIIKSELKPKLLGILKTDYKIELATLFPDTAGAAEAVKADLFQNMEIFTPKK